MKFKTACEGSWGSRIQGRPYGRKNHLVHHRKMSGTNHFSQLPADLPLGTFEWLGKMKEAFYLILIEWYLVKSYAKHLFFSKTQWCDVGKNLKESSQQGWVPWHTMHRCDPHFGAAGFLCFPLHKILWNLVDTLLLLIRTCSNEFWSMKPWLNFWGMSQARPIRREVWQTERATLMYGRRIVQLYLLKGEI